MGNYFSSFPVVVSLACFAIIANLNWYVSKKENKFLLAELNKPIMAIAEFYDQDNNGLFDSYKLVNKFRDGSEKDVSSLKGVRYYTPFGGEVRESYRAQLEIACDEWGYLGVDKIRFKP